MKHQIDMDKLALGLGAERVGKVSGSGGYFGAMQLAAEVVQRFRVPSGGGRATVPEWTERRLIPLSRETLTRLEEMADNLHVAPLQVAALLLEQMVNSIEDREISELRESVARYKTK